MESAFGVGFHHVRIHTDSTAASLSSHLKARAFTVGEHIALGSGEYRPGTAVGDALIAHELAHTVQQGAASRPAATKPAEGNAYNTLEEDADRSAVGAVVSLWAKGTASLKELAKHAMPRLKSGLRLQRCKDEPRTPAHPSLADKAATLGGDSLAMDSYRNFQSKAWKWFLSPNDTLAGRAGKPSAMGSWENWDSIHWMSQEVIADLTTNGLDPTKLGRTEVNLNKLKAAYARWPADKFAVFWSATAYPTNTCNIFLGDALFMDGKNQVRDGKYFLAGEVYNEAGNFVANQKGDVYKGDIAAWGGHVEIVTSVDQARGSFCSRGGYREPMGGEKCGGPSRTISLATLRFLRVKP
jgi:hypothetical protein